MTGDEENMREIYVIRLQTDIHPPLIKKKNGKWKKNRVNFLRLSPKQVVR